MLPRQGWLEAGFGAPSSSSPSQTLDRNQYEAHKEADRRPERERELASARRMPTDVDDDGEWNHTPSSTCPSGRGTSSRPSRGRTDPLWLTVAPPTPTFKLRSPGEPTQSASPYLAINGPRGR
ncbi:hypothetical protein GWK47_016149 [Chionoecetes opilio]|uniref:Uncharacterized protein n=1 Tax=Chionoecetes opilio TaxID=41210 RepID=A0A8J4XYA8_CHIOP|nr:hypothetical protein GWK47_016149 [Chionoecetes opilio]